jgi:hypothetical protein
MTNLITEEQVDALLTLKENSSNKVTAFQVTPDDSHYISEKLAKDTFDGKVNNSGDETINGIKTFTSFSITPSSAPTTNYQVANKKYVDDVVSGYVGFVNLTTDQTIGGIKTFTSFMITPSSAPTTNYQTANKKYVDDSINGITGFVNLTSDQTIAGIKTFSSFAITPSSAPTTNYQTANKKYVDDAIAGISLSSYVTLSTT